MSYAEFLEPSERVIPPSIQLYQDVQAARERIFSDCVEKGGYGYDDPITKAQEGVATILSDRFPARLATADAVELDHISYNLVPGVQLNLQLFSDGSPHVLDKDLEVFDKLDDRPENTYVLHVNPEMPPQLVNDALIFEIKGRLAGDTIRSGQPARQGLAREELQVARRFGLIHFLNDAEAKAVSDVLKLAQPDFECFADVRDTFKISALDADTVQPE